MPDVLVGALMIIKIGAGVALVGILFCLGAAIPIGIIYLVHQILTHPVPDNVDELGNPIEEEDS